MEQNEILQDIRSRPEGVTERRLREKFLQDSSLDQEEMFFKILRKLVREGRIARRTVQGVIRYVPLKTFQ